MLALRGFRRRCVSQTLRPTLLNRPISHQLQKREFAESLESFRSLSAVERNEKRKSPVAVMKLLRHIGNKEEVHQYLKYYTDVEAARFCVIKVGGDVLQAASDSVASSLATLSDLGLIPIIVHGARPQIDEALNEMGFTDTNVHGVRVTSPQVLKVVRKVVAEENLKLVKAIESRGAFARPVQCGVFEVDYEDKGVVQLVGKVVSVDTDSILHSIDCGRIPVVTCLGETEGGQILNISADSAAYAIAKALKPVKTVYVTETGSIGNSKGIKLANIDLDDIDFDDYDSVSESVSGENYDIEGKGKVMGWSPMVSGQIPEDNFQNPRVRSQLREIKELLQELPASSSVAVTSPTHLLQELFSHKGSGTLVRKSEGVIEFDSMKGVDTKKLCELIETTYARAKLSERYIDYISSRIERIYVTENYRACAIVTKSDLKDGLYYLDQLGMEPGSEHSAHHLWNRMTDRYPNLFWRSQVHMPLNQWFYDRSDGSFTQNGWQVFWHGIQSTGDVAQMVETAVAMPLNLQTSIGIANKEGTRGFSTLSKARSSPPSSSMSSPSASLLSLASSASTLSSSSSLVSSSILSSSLVMGRAGRGNHMRSTRGSRSFSSNSKAPTLGIIGGRGHTGAELLKLIDNHKGFDLKLVSSRVSFGKTVGEVNPHLSSDCNFTGLKFENVTPADIPKHKHIDVWVLALPNTLAKPYVEAIDDSNSKATIVDLSADYRFDDTWTYGLPELNGNRSLLKKSTRISNPGCYATVMQVALSPLLSMVSHSHSPTIFGVSGYSGAGTTPSRKNDPNELKNNLIPYSLLGHIHEKEVSHQLKGFMSNGVKFMPHVASWFRGITITVAMDLCTPISTEELFERYNEFYEDEKLVRVQESIPEVKDIALDNSVAVGGFLSDPLTRRCVLTATIDNLLKGAATQAMQNLNLSLGFPEYRGII